MAIVFYISGHGFGHASREVEVINTLAPSLRASGGYLFADARFADGNEIPQVPRHQATAQLQYSGPFTAAIQGRWSAMQFDDDLNELPLDGYLVADVFLGWPVTQGIDIVLGAENIFDETIEVSATPVTTIGQPRAFRLGIRYVR